MDRPLICAALAAAATLAGCGPSLSQRISPSDTGDPTLPELTPPEAPPLSIALSGRGDPASGGSEYILYTPRGGAVLGAPLAVVFHGYEPSPSPDTVARLMARFADRGFAVLWIAMCEPIDCTMNLDDYTDDAEAAYRAAYARLGSRPPSVFVGYSIGSHVAARLASRLGRDDTGRRGPPPRALVLLDPAGYDATFGGRLLGIGREALAGIPAETLLLLLRAQGSIGDDNATGTGSRLFHHAPVRHKAAFVVPHICVTRRAQRVVFSCPTDMGSCRGGAYRCYISDHVSLVAPEELRPPLPPLGPVGTLYADAAIEVAACAVAETGARCLEAPDALRPLQRYQPSKMDE